MTAQAQTIEPTQRRLSSDEIFAAAHVHLPGADERCPICWKRYSLMPDRIRTIGHLKPRDPKGGKHQRGRKWIWLCYKCNHRMANKTLRNWRNDLAHRCASSYMLFQGDGLRWLNCCRVIRQCRRYGLNKRSF